MSKQQSELEYIFKIHSSVLRRNKWSLNLSIEEARKNGQIISLASSTTLRFIRQINKSQISKEYVLEIKRQIKSIKKLQNSPENKKTIKQLYIKKNELLFVKDYVCIVMDSKKDFDRCNIKKGFFINGIKFKRLLGTTGGIKNETIVYVNEKIYDELNKRINNGRNINIPLVPAKLEAYKSLACSSSTPVSNPKGILVVKDGFTQFKTDVITINDEKTVYPEMKYEKDYTVDFQFCDGCAMILPSLSKKWAEELGEDYTPTGFNIRNSWCKGMVFTFDFFDFAKNVAKKYIVKDAWGNDVDIRNVELILTTSMLKLWDSYNSLEHYLKCCEENEYTFSVAKMCPKELERKRNMNYQFLQSYELSDNDINELLNPTINEIHEVLGGDYRKALLFLKGIYINDNNCDSKEYDFIKALMIEPKMINDPFVKQRIHSMIEKRITDAKIGVIQVDGNYSVVSGDLYALCQHIFGIKVTGLLKANHYYARTWLDKGVTKIVSFRAPMTCHNNIRVMNLTDNDEVKHWFKYMTTCTVINAWDTTTHAMNGMDEDADSLIETDNAVLLRNTKEQPALVCMQKSATKKVVTEEDLMQSNKNGFGDEIGSITNRITAMFEVLAQFEKDSLEYNEIMYRIKCGQHYQQNSIDKIKGIFSKPMPKEWYEYEPNKIDEKKDSNETKLKKEFNLKILANKKPYFFIYIYPNIMNTYKKYIRDTNTNCLRRFGLTVDELKNKENKTDYEKTYLEYFEKRMPVGVNACTSNRICWKIEKEFDGFLTKIKDEVFDYSILKSDVKYDNKTYKAVEKIYKEYNRTVRQYSQTTKKERISKEEKNIRRSIFKESFKEQAYKICNNKYELCNIAIDLCYTNNNSKQFVWDIVGEVIIDNLLKLNDYKIKYPVMDENGDIEFSGYKFSMHGKIIQGGLK